MVASRTKASAKGSRSLLFTEICGLFILLFSSLIFSMQPASAQNPSGRVAALRITSQQTSVVESSAIVILAKSSVWVRIEDKQGNMIVSQIFHAGDQYAIPKRDDLLIDARDGGQLVYLVGGIEHGKLGNDGEILLSRPLSFDTTLDRPDHR